MPKLWFIRIISCSDFKSVTCILGVLLTTIYGYSAENVSDLVNLSYRPRPTEFLSFYHGQLPDSNPYASKAKPIVLTNEDKMKIAKSIVKLEEAFPGATWAFLGRDSALLYEIFYTFYSSIGQPERVVRLDASTPSINSADKSVLMEFLESNGLNVKDLDHGHPYVMIDTTSFSKNSQSYKLMVAAMKKIKELSIPKDFINTKLNFVSLNKGSIELKDDKVLPFLIDQNRHVGEFSVPEPNRILTISAPLTYTSEWHEPFIGFTRLSGGEIEPIPGAIKDENSRYQILADMYEVTLEFSSSEFHNLVDKVSNGKFNFKRPKALTRNAVILKEYFKNIGRGDDFTAFVNSDNFDNELNNELLKLTSKLNEYFKEVPPEVLARGKDVLAAFILTKYWFSLVPESGFQKNKYFASLVANLVNVVAGYHSASQYANGALTVRRTTSDRLYSDHNLSVDEQRLFLVDLALLESTENSIQDYLAKEPTPKGFRDRLKTINWKAVLSPSAIVKSSRFWIPTLAALSADFGPVLLQNDPYANHSFLLTGLVTAIMAPQIVYKFYRLGKAERNQQILSFDSVVKQKAEITAKIGGFSTQSLKSNVEHQKNLNLNLCLKLYN